MIRTFVVTIYALFPLKNNHSHSIRLFDVCVELNWLWCLTNHIAVRLRKHKLPLLQHCLEHQESRSRHRCGGDLRGLHGALGGSQGLHGALGESEGAPWSFSIRGFTTPWNFGGICGAPWDSKWIWCLGSPQLWGALWVSETWYAWEVLSERSPCLNLGPVLLLDLLRGEEVILRKKKNCCETPTILKGYFSNSYISSLLCEPSC